jgi:hypothetical protein
MVLKDLKVECHLNNAQIEINFAKWACSITTSCTFEDHVNAGILLCMLCILLPLARQAVCSLAHNAQILPRVL